MIKHISFQEPNESNTELIIAYNIQRSKNNTSVMTYFESKRFENPIVLFTYGSTFSLHLFPKSCIQDINFIIDKHEKQYVDNTYFPLEESFSFIDLEERVYKAVCGSHQFELIGTIPHFGYCWKKYSLGLVIPTSISSGTLTVIVVLSVFLVKKAKRLSQLTQDCSEIHNRIASIPLHIIKKLNDVYVKGIRIIIKRVLALCSSSIVTEFLTIGNEGGSYIVNYLTIVDTDKDKYNLDIYIRKCTNVIFDHLPYSFREKFENAEGNEMSFYVFNRSKEYKHFPFMNICVNRDGYTSYTCNYELLTIYNGITGYLVGRENTIDFLPYNKSFHRAAYFEFGKDIDEFDENYMEIELQGDDSVDPNML